MELYKFQCLSDVTILKLDWYADEIMFNHDYDSCEIEYLDIS